MRNYVLHKGEKNYFLHQIGLFSPINNSYNVLKMGKFDKI